MSNNKQSSVEYFSQKSHVLFEMYSEGKITRITLNISMTTLTKECQEMELAGKEMSYADGYSEGYKRALEMVEWYIKNHIKVK
jgi:hypothetical protein